MTSGQTPDAAAVKRLALGDLELLHRFDDGAAALTAAPDPPADVPVPPTYGPTADEPEADVPA